MKVAYIHFYVEDSQRSRNWFIKTMGFEGWGQMRNSHTQTEIIGINEIIFLISSPLHQNSPVATYLQNHPSGVADIAFYIEDLVLLTDKLATLKIETLENEFIAQSTIQTIKLKSWGGLEHTLIDAQQQEDLRHYLKQDLNPSNLSNDPDSEYQPAIFNNNPNIHITGIDHVVLNVERHQLSAVVNWYKTVFDLQIQQLFNIETDYSSLYSEALIDKSGQLQFNINEPTSANSQIQDFLNFNNGPGIQHIALSTDRIIQTVQALKSNNLNFLTIPNEYYQRLKTKQYSIIQNHLTPQEWQHLKNLNILLDVPQENPQSLLMQIFTLPLFEQPTFFLELIERRQRAQGFGAGNFMALFQAVEQLFLNHYAPH
ncbi:MAG: 4-hydroxyphenylpyruvate dioxygenase [Snowella sp.]|nr:4-hydroxyphenylpyruvate dioxygenase [Snowella sp.]